MLQCLLVEVLEGRMTLQRALTCLMLFPCVPFSPSRMTPIDAPSTSKFATAQHGCTAYLAAASVRAQQAATAVQQRTAIAAAATGQGWRTANTKRTLGLPRGWAILGAAVSALLLVIVLSTAIPLSRRHRHAGSGVGPAPGQESPLLPGMPSVLPQPPWPGIKTPHEFVRVNSRMQLEANCRPLYIVGFNAYDLVEMVMLPESGSNGSSTNSSLGSGPGTAADYGTAGLLPLDQRFGTADATEVPGTGTAGYAAAVEQQEEGMLPGPGQASVAASMAAAAALGLNTVRTWAHTSNPKAPFQIAPGNYSEEGLRALDFVLHQASLLRLKVILCLVDNWHYYNGVDQYIDWSPSAPPRQYDRLEDAPGDPAPERVRGDAVVAGPQEEQYPWDAAYALNSTGRTKPLQAHNNTTVSLVGPNGTIIASVDGAFADISSAAPVAPGANGSMAVGNSTTTGSAGAVNGSTLGGAAAAAAPTREQRVLYEKARHALFWTDPGSRQLYRDHAQAITQRRNTYNGQLYWQDPTILAWELVNEPRCEARPACHENLQSWIQEMSAWVKSLTPMQLVTIGSEGFFGPSTPELLKFNPGEWAAHVGQDFARNNAPDTIDFATLHVWPDNWGINLPQSPNATGGNLSALPGPTNSSVSNTTTNTTTRPAAAAGNLTAASLLAANQSAAANSPAARFTRSWVYSHLYVPPSAGGLAKPVLLEEFGKKLVGSLQVDDARQLRDPIYHTVYSLTQRRTALDLGMDSTQAPQLRTVSASAVAQDPYLAGELASQEAAIRAATAESRAGGMAGNVRSLPLAGSLFWKWNTAQPDSTDEYGVLASQSTARLIARHAATMSRLVAQEPDPDPGCREAVQKERVRVATGP